MDDHPIIEICPQGKIPPLGSVLDRRGLKLWPSFWKKSSDWKNLHRKVNCLLPGAPMATKSASLKDKILYRIEAKKPFAVWTSRDFIVLASRKLVDKALQQLSRSGELRRIGRGLYDKPSFDSFTNQPTSPDYREVIKAVSRRDQARMLIDGLTAANDLGLTNSVPARVVVHTDARLFPIRVGNLVVKFKKTSASRLYWAGRPAMKVSTGPPLAKGHASR